MLSRFSRLLTVITAILYSILGIALFVAPGWASANFAWKVTPFFAMTIGGWCIGNAYAAWDSARVWSWSRVYPVLVYLWVFGLFEVLVLVEFRSRVLLTGPTAWLYILTLGVNFLAAVLGIIDWLRLRPPVRQEGSPIPTTVRVSLIVFALALFFIILLGLTAQEGGFFYTGGLFPENLSRFTIHAVAAFFFSLAISALSIRPGSGMIPVLTYERSGIALILPILAAALVNLDKFDFANRPGGLIYIGAYIVALVGVLLTLANARKQESTVERAA